MTETLLDNSKLNSLKSSDEASLELLKCLLEIVKNCQVQYGGKKELATEKDPLITKLCDVWEKVLSHGLKTRNISLFQNVQDIVSGNNISEQPTFWDFAETHLTNHEKDRFSALRHIWTSGGRTRALIRSALNERSLERYILMWLSDAALQHIYEYWALMRNDEAVNLLPSIAAGLSSILFAIIIDTPEMNVSKTDAKKQEPIIYVPKPVGPSKKSIAVKRQIVSFDEKTAQQEMAIVEGNNMPAIVEPILENSYTSVDFNISNTVSNKTDFENSSLPIEQCFDITEHPEMVLTNRIDQINLLSEDHNSDIDDNNEKNKEYPGSLLLDNASVSSTESKPSSLQSSNSSVLLKGEVNQLTIKVKELMEKCSFLEARVAELSLENHRLRWLTNHTNREVIQFFITIPTAVLLRTGPRKYYKYHIQVNATNSIDEWVVFKRYSEFYKMHQKLQKNNTIVKALDFPPKKKIGNLDISFVEERRQRLQIYLRHLLAVLPEISSCTTKAELQTAFPFLK